MGWSDPEHQVEIGVSIEIDQHTRREDLDTAPVYTSGKRWRQAVGPRRERPVAAPHEKVGTDGSGRGTPIADVDIEIPITVDVTESGGIRISRRLRQRRRPIRIRAVGVRYQQEIGLAWPRRFVIAERGDEDIRAPVAIEVAGENVGRIDRARQGAGPEQLTGDVDDRPVGLRPQHAARPLDGWRRRKRAVAHDQVRPPVSLQIDRLPRPKSCRHAGRHERLNRRI